MPRAACSVQEPRGLAGDHVKLPCLYTVTQTLILYIYSTEYNFGNRTGFGREQRNTVGTVLYSAMVKRGPLQKQLGILF